MAFANIPSGTTERLAIRSAFSCASDIPITAGMIVDGTVPKAPPTKPPYLSISTVTSVATRPAIIAASKTCSSTNGSEPHGS